MTEWPQSQGFEPPPSEPPVHESKSSASLWPTVIGIILIVFGAAGVVFGCIGTVFQFLTPFIADMVGSFFKRLFAEFFGFHRDSECHIKDALQHVLLDGFNVSAAFENKLCH